MKAAPAPRPYPDRMYVAIPEITKKISLFVFVICILSLAVSIITGFTLIERLMSILIAALSIGFYFMGKMLSRAANRK